jgi:hypothetical protein
MEVNHSLHGIWTPRDTIDLLRGQVSVLYIAKPLQDRKPIAIATLPKVVVQVQLIPWSILQSLNPLIKGFDVHQLTFRQRLIKSYRGDPKNVKEGSVIINQQISQDSPPDLFPKPL